MLPVPTPFGRGIDRLAHRRVEPGLITRLRHAASTSVVLVDAGRLAMASQGLLLVPPTQVPWPDGLWFYLGEDGGSQFLATAPFPAAPSLPVTSPAPEVPFAGTQGPSSYTWAGLREVLPQLTPRDADLATTAVALEHWHARHGFCPQCGAATDTHQAGWTRQCPAGHVLFPRTDPAVIMAVTDDADRILLGHAATWPPGRFSTLAGFVEPGENLESAVQREVFEETAVMVDDVRYAGSQPWPFPASLMVAFCARARTHAIRVDGTEVTDARWFTRDQLAAQLAAGTVAIAPRGSIARALIEQWYGGNLRSGGF